jgi:membrane protein
MLGRMAKRVWLVLRATWDGWLKDEGFLLSAATAYYAVFSLFPVCLVLIAGLGFVGQYSTFVQTEQHTLLRHIAENISPWLADELQVVLSGVQARAMLGGPLGILFLIVAAIGVFTQLENIFDRIWATPKPGGGFWASVRAALWDRLLAFVTLLSIGTLLLAVFLADVILAGIRPYLSQLAAGRSTWRIIQIVSTIGCNGLLLTAVYRMLPQARVRWLAAFAGGLLAAIVWALGRSVLLSLLVGQQYSAYGVVGALMGIMIWFYYASAVVFLGAEFVHALGPAGER